MENLVEFEESSIFKITIICLGISYILLYLNHFIMIIKLLKEKQNQKLELFFKGSSCIHIFAQLIFSSVCFCLLHRFHLTNSVFLILSNLVGIIATLETLCIYIFFYHNDNIILACVHIALPIALPIIIMSILLTTEEVNKTIEIILINISFVFYLFMFISPGLNIIKFFQTANPNFISFTNTILGIFVNIFMIFFLAVLSKYKIASITFIIYPIIAFIICILQIIYYIMKNNKYNNTDDLIEKVENVDTSEKDKPFSLIKNDSIEEE